MSIDLSCGFGRVQPGVSIAGVEPRWWPFQSQRHLAGELPRWLETISIALPVISPPAAAERMVVAMPRQ